MTMAGASGGGPGLPSNWAPGAKQAVGTAVGAASPLWFTLAQGVVTEIYYPRVDIPNTRDLQFLVRLPGGEFWEERRDAATTVDLIDPRALAWKVVTADREGRFRLEKRIIADPSRPTLAVETRWFWGEGGELPGTRLYALLAPHLGGRNDGNSAQVTVWNGRPVAVAWGHDTWLTFGSSRPFLRAGCGFVGVDDGWTQLRAGRERDWDQGTALNGNVAITAQLGISAAEPFTLAVGFGREREEACANSLATVDAGYAGLEDAYITGWRRWCADLTDLSEQSGDGGKLYYLSAMVLKAHEDKQNPGSHIASLGIPWGETSGDDAAGGYHLVWPRDLYQIATGRLACGDAQGARAAFHCFIRTQRGDGSWPQNFRVHGDANRRSLQLDEIALPILLAWQLKVEGALEFNPYPSVVAPAAYAVARVGPVAPQERWEEGAGYSASSLATAVAALVCAAEFAREENDRVARAYFLDVADYWASHLEEWTFTTQGGVLPGMSEHYQRVAGGPDDVTQEGVGLSVTVANRMEPPLPEPGAVIDGGFLQLVRYAVRRPDDLHIRKSLPAYDAACRTETPFGPCWRRHSRDGYGEKADGSPYDGQGVGRAWPLLTGERAHYALAAGEDVTPLLSALESFAGPTGMLPEQVWDEASLPARNLSRGRPTGSVAPLAWTHAEYIKLLRSLRDGVVYDCPEPVRRRYGSPRRHPHIWKFNHKLRRAPAGARLCIEVHALAALHWSADDWRSVRHDAMKPRGHGVWTYEWPEGNFPSGTRLDFTFFWPESRTWEERNFSVVLT